jgi:Flp pilus assembly protein TadG
MYASSRRKRPARPAVAAVEFAVILPLLMILILGMFELSRVLLVKETLSNAAQQACRTASRQATTNSDVAQEVTDVMSAAGINSSSVTIQVNDAASDVATAKRFDKVSVRVSVPVSQVFWVSTIFVSGSTIESETVVMMRQG